VLVLAIANPCAAEAGELLARARRTLEASGADFLVLCTNTMHEVAPQIEAAMAIPLLHIARPYGTAPGW